MMTGGHSTRVGFGLGWLGLKGCNDERKGGRGKREEGPGTQAQRIAQLELSGSTRAPLDLEFDPLVRVGLFQILRYTENDKF